MNILLTGAGGQLGSELAMRLTDAGWRVDARTHRGLDISNSDHVYDAFASGPIDLVINAAAYSAVDRAEQEEDKAFSVNAEGPGRLARACATHGAALFHFSTDYVFDGSKDEPYVETDAPSPGNAYGRTKETGERIVRAELDRHLIIRTAWLFGVQGRNFVTTMLKLAAANDELRVVADQRGNPTAACDLAQCVVELTRKLDRSREGDFRWGTYHCVNQGSVSWYNFARAIIGHAAPMIGRNPSVQPVTSTEYLTPASRPANSRLDCTKLRRHFDISMPSWRPALHQVIEGTLIRYARKPARGTA